MSTALRRRIAWLFGYHQVPFAVRGIFRYEALHMAAWGAAWGCLNAPFCMYVAHRSLDAPPAAVSVIGASMAIANLFAIWWGALAIRFDGKRLLIACLFCIAVLMSSVALTPMLGAGRTAWTFTGLIVLIWVAVQASNTVRTSLWRNNYPDHLRGQILGRFAIWQMLMGGLFALFAGAYLDGGLRFPFGAGEVDLRFLPGAAQPDAYRYIFPVGAAFALLAGLLYRRVRVRRRHRTGPPVPRLLPGALGFTDAAPAWLATWVLGFRTGLRETIGVLRDDAPYRRYMFWQMVAGSANLAMIVPLVFILDEHFDVSYLSAAGLVAFVPQIVIVVTTPFWARRFDHWDIYRFRTVQMIFWCSGATVMALATWQRSLPLMFLGFAVRGGGESASRLSWQLGHMAFAPARKDALYMGAHQALTGVRGLTMPFLGMVLYRSPLGWHVIWIAAAFQAFSAWGFSRLRRRDGTPRRPASVPRPVVAKPDPTAVAAQG